MSMGRHTTRGRKGIWLEIVLNLQPWRKFCPSIFIDNRPWMYPSPITVVQTLWLRIIFRCLLLIRIRWKTIESEFNFLQVPLCKMMELSREYARLCTFAWMFVEGVYLNSLLSTAVFRRPNFLWYYLVGWGKYNFVFQILLLFHIFSNHPSLKK